MDDAPHSRDRWSRHHWNAIAHALERAWEDAHLPAPEFQAFRDWLYDELTARGMVRSGGWGFYSHDQLMTILRGALPYDETRWRAFRRAVELHLFHEKPPP